MSENQALEQSNDSADTDPVTAPVEAVVEVKEVEAVQEQKAEVKPVEKERRDVIHFSQRQLAERLDRAKKVGITDFVKSLGFEKEEDIRETINLYNEKQPEKLEQLMNGKIQELEGNKSILEQQLAKEKLSKDVVLAAFQSGLTDANYGEFLYLRHLGTLTDKELETVTPKGFFASMKNEPEKAQFFNAVSKPVDTNE